MSLLKIDGLEASYGPVAALRGISIDVPEGGIVTLLGANGAGKSTTLKCISGVVKPRRGTIEWKGQQIAGRSPNWITRTGIAQVPEGRRIFKDLTVSENLIMGAYSRSNRAEIGEDQDHVFDLFPRLKERSKQLGGTLSGGEQQMLAIGRGLMARPSLLLLDEPSLGLAPILVSDIFETLLRLNRERGLALLIVEQNMAIALKVSQFGYVMQLGQVMVSGPSEQLRTDKKVFESYLGVTN
jgi:branched-chain amino acid transport system ATP-binding protein